MYKITSHIDLVYVQTPEQTIAGVELEVDNADCGSVDDSNDNVLVTQSGVSSQRNARNAMNATNVRIASSSQ